MDAEIFVPGATIVALVACIRHLARVFQSMTTEIGAIGAAILALVADKRLLARVRQLVAMETGARGAAKVALVAVERLLTRVRPLVAMEKVACGAAIVALVAGKRRGGAFKGAAIGCRHGPVEGRECRRGSRGSRGGVGPQLARHKRRRRGKTQQVARQGCSHNAFGRHVHANRCATDGSLRTA